MMFVKTLVALFFLTTLTYFRTECECIAVQGKSMNSRELRDLKYKLLLSNPNTTTASSATIKRTHAPIKKWQVGRVSRKQYEIINMLWRKSNVFNDVVDTTPAFFYETNPTKPKPTTLMPRFSPAPQERLRKTIRSSVHAQTSTSSYIEFYYLDELDDINSTSFKQRPQISSPRWKPKPFSRSPFFAFHFNEPDYNRFLTTLTSTGKSLRSNPRLRKKFIAIIGLPPNAHKSNLRIITQTMPPDIISDQFNDPSTSSKANGDDDFLDNETCAMTSTSTPASTNSATEKLSYYTVPPTDASLSTTYDKIKFFEMYDSNTHEPVTTFKKVDYIDHTECHYVNANEKILLEHVDNDMRNNETLPKARYAKKHVTTTDFNISSFVPSTTMRNFNNINIVNNLNNSKLSVVPKLLFNEVAVVSVSNRSKYVELTEYPFAAVYVYDRYQVHCDAAIISPHWLIAAGSCLSRHTKEPTLEGRSAFVSYCGENWWDPERITYVKYSVVHPRFHPIEKSRRNLYNIGLIQVVTSMAQACTSFSPISIISHNFGAEHGGSIATAVGWGLDRYDRQRISKDLPRKPLSVYEGLIHSDSCPGNSEFRRINIFFDDILKNVYCLSLPPYIREDTDPVHGGLLLVGGKLIGLYLQEERRPWGEQSAQYTGIWRLVPWVHDVAREPEETDFSL